MAETAEATAAETTAGVRDAPLGNLLVPTEAKSPFADIISPERIAQVSGELSGIEAQRGGEMERSGKELEGSLGRHRQQMERAYQHESAGPGSLPPAWNADQERADRIRGPMESFGSVATIFALAASAFTKTPMLNALNAGAAAMNAIHASDERGYEAAYTAWKDNTQLAMKRFDMERALFDDANKLATTDVAAWRVKQMEIAARYDNKKAQLLLANGMDKELIDLQNAQIKGRAELMESVEKYDLFEAKRSLWKQMVEQFDNDHPDATVGEKLQYRKEALENLNGGPKAVEAQLLQRYRQHVWDTTGHAPDPEDEAKFLSELRWSSRVPAVERQISELSSQLQLPPDQGGEGLPKAEADLEARKRTMTAQKPAHVTPIEQQISELAEKLQLSSDEGGEGLSKTDALIEARKRTMAAQKPPSVGVLTPGREQTQEIVNRTKKYETDSNSPTHGNHEASRDRAEREVKAAAAAITGNKREELEAKIDKYSNSNQVIEKVLGIIEHHKAAAGIAGKAMRLEERLANLMAGSPETDRVQMMRDVELLRGWAQQLLFDRAGRPLVKEADRIDSIVGGTSAGDTGTNTVRALKDLKDLYNQLSEQAQKRLKGEWTAPKTETPAGGTPKKKDWWKGDKRSDLGVEGARQAPDGNWYVDDPDRPGKYLMVANA